ncbi:MAG TPA: FAD-dependent oxidoreductase [Phycisphaerales bacterium]|nr:FAD-dependent oxidoreductase [Phycisphaerales bacterium]
MVVGEFTQEAELVVIGGGPGGYSAAFRAAELGIQTILIDERDQLGGACLHASLPKRCCISRRSSASAKAPLGSA